MNHPAKFDAASFILPRRRNPQLYNSRTKLQQQQKNKQTVNDTSTSCLSACVDNEIRTLFGDAD